MSFLSKIWRKKVNQITVLYVYLCIVEMKAMSHVYERKIYKYIQSEMPCMLAR